MSPTITAEPSEHKEVQRERKGDGYRRRNSRRDVEKYEGRN